MLLADTSFFDTVFLDTDGWWYRLLWNRKTRSLILWLVRYLPIRCGRVLFVSRAGQYYSCNPRAIAEKMLAQGEQAKGFDLWFYLDNPSAHSDLPEGLRTVSSTTLQYYYIASTSQFIVANQFVWAMEPKRHGQILVQTLHGGHGIKRIGLDGDAKHDPIKNRAIHQFAANTDLVLSESDFFTRVIRSAFAVKCEILEQGLPRNDIFFRSESELQEISTRVKDSLGIPPTAQIVLYAPTFRDIPDFTLYSLPYQAVVEAFERRFGGQWYIAIGCHPYMQGYYKEMYRISHSRVIFAGEVGDFQHLLVASSALITDYSSAEMDFSLLRRPVFQFAIDREKYDRGFYLDPHTLPFPFAESESQLLHCIETFDEESYLEKLQVFNAEIIGLHETGRATNAVVDWIKQHRATL